MAKMDLRVRLFGRLVGLMSVAHMDEARLRKAQQQRISHNPLTDLVFGAVAEGLETTDGTAKGEVGPVPIRAYRPARAAAGPRPLVVNFHGGGWTIGSLDSADWLCSHVAADLDAVVVSVDYRLAPFHRFPAAAEDCYSALVDLVGRAAEFGADPERVAVMGDSAGGNLAAVVAQLAKKQGGPPIAFQLLVYPATDRFDDSPSMRENALGPLLSRAWIEWFLGCYLNSPDEGQDPRVSPGRAEDLSGLPPALVITAEFDPLRDQGAAYVGKLREAGVDAQLLPVDGMIHGFIQMSGVLDKARETLDKAGDALRTALA
jgi:acetyl esterase